MFGVAAPPTRKSIGLDGPVKSLIVDHVPRVNVAVTSPGSKSPWIA